MPDQATHDPSTAPARKGAGIVAKARAHKALAAVIAVAGFLGLGGIFGQWAVDRVGDLVGGDSPPAGFDELYGAWEDTAQLNERLVTAGGEANKNLEQGVTVTVRGTNPPELEGSLKELRAVKNEASGLAGEVRAVSTDLPGPRADLRALVIRLRDTAQRVHAGVLKAYGAYGGEPFLGGSAGFSPIFLQVDDMYDDVREQDELVRQVAAGLRPIARQFERAVPEIRGWNRLAYPDHPSDAPQY